MKSLKITSKRLFQAVSSQSGSLFKALIFTKLWLMTVHQKLQKLEFLPLIVQKPSQKKPKRIKVF